MRKAYHVKPSVCFQVFSRQTASRSRLAIPIAGEPPKTRFPWTASFNPSAGSGFKPTANPSPIADTASACAHAAPAPRMLGAPSYRTVPQADQFFATQKIAQPAGQRNLLPLTPPPLRWGRTLQVFHSPFAFSAWNPSPLRIIYLPSSLSFSRCQQHRQNDQDEHHVKICHLIFSFLYFLVFSCSKVQSRNPLFVFATLSVLCRHRSQRT